MNLRRKSLHIDLIDDIEILGEISKLNSSIIKKMIKKGRLDKVCSIMVSICLDNLRLRNRSMRKSVSIQESISAAYYLNRRLRLESLKNIEGDYID